MCLGVGEIACYDSSSLSVEAIFDAEEIKFDHFCIEYDCCLVVFVRQKLMIEWDVKRFHKSHIGVKSFTFAGCQFTQV